MSAASKKVSQDLSKDLGDASKTGSQQLSRTLSQDMTKGLGGQNRAVGDLTKLGDSITKVGTDSQSATTGLSSLISKLGSLGGGLGGDAGAAGGVAAGFFSEGGFSDSPVSSSSFPSSFWDGAPAYADGTSNTSGGTPAILHPNEAVIPLSRGRGIPVEMKAGDAGDDVNHITYNMHSNVKLTEGDTFRRSPGQMASELQKQMGRLAARNN